MEQKRARAEYKMNGGQQKRVPKKGTSTQKNTPVHYMGQGYVFMRVSPD